MPPFFEAVLILLSTLKQRTPNQQLPLAVPTLVPTGLEVALTGLVTEQAVKSITDTTEAAKMIFLNIGCLINERSKVTKEIQNTNMFSIKLQLGRLACKKSKINA